MGPGDNTMTSALSTLKVLDIPKLSEDGSNWGSYKERVLNHLTSKGLARHVRGTASKPKGLIDRNGEFYRPGAAADAKPLTEEEIEKVETDLDAWDTKQAQVREIIYATISKTTYIQIKGAATVSDLWTKLASIHEIEKGPLVHTDILAKLQSSRYNGKNMRTHITNMRELREQLDDIGHPIDDASFAAYVRVSLGTPWRPFLSALQAGASASGRPLELETLLNALYVEADNVQAEKNITSAASNSNSAMSAESNRKGKGRGGKSKKEKSDKHCDNCNKDGHTKESCFAKGGGKEHDAPEWWKKKVAKKDSGSEKKEKANANVADQEEYAFLVHGLTKEIAEDVEEEYAFVVTSDFAEYAQTANSIHTGIIIDCGASTHFTPDRESLINYKNTSDPIPIRAADGRIFQATGKGDLRIEIPNGPGNKPTRVTLTDVYYSPNMAFTLVSVSRMTRAGYKLLFIKELAVIKSPKSKIIGRVPELRGLYRIRDVAKPRNAPQKSPEHSANVAAMSINDLHRKMGHINHDDLRDMVRKGMVTGIDLDLDSKPIFCETCVKAKAARKSFPKVATGTSTKAYGDKVVADVWGPASKESLGHNRYYTLFQDRHSHEEKIYFMREKSEALDKYKKYEAWVNVQRNAKIKILGTDRGGEFTSKAFQDLLEDHGTVRHLTVHDSPASNGAAERGNRTHLEGARAMLIQSQLPTTLWAEAVRHSVWLRNRAPTRALDGNKTPLEMATGEKPDLSELHEWGSVIWVKILNAGKLEPHAEEVRFVGFDEESKGYRVYWKGKNRISVERDIYFDKNEALLPDVQIEGENDDEFFNPAHPATDLRPKAPETNLETQDINANHNQAPSDTEKRDTEPTNSPESATSSPPAANFPHETSSKSPQTDTAHPPKRSLRPNALPTGFYHEKNQEKRGESAQLTEYAHFASFEEWFNNGNVPVDECVMETIEECQAMASLSEDEPRDDEALVGKQKDEWIRSMQAELDYIEKVHTYDIIRRPPDATNIIPSRWVLRRKRDSKNNIARYKSRLVAKGFKQRPGDYEDTFAPTVRSATLRIILATAATKKSLIHQADAKNAYLHGHNGTGEIFYMNLAPHYTKLRSLPADLANVPLDQLVCIVWRPLYGSKQGACRFYKFLKDFLTALGYQVCAVDEAVFYKFKDDGTYQIIAAATDDFTLVADSEASMASLKADLSSKLELVDLGEIHWLLGMSVKYDRSAGNIILGQEAYIDQLLIKFGLTDARTCDTPLQPGVDLTPGSQHVSDEKLTPKEQSEYRGRVGSIMYLAEMTRGDVRYAVSQLSQYFECAYKTHMHAVTRVLRYLKGTKNLHLVLGGSNLNLASYCDADFAQQLHRHSISGYVSFIGQGAVSWSSKKQSLVTLSSTEAEYVATTHAAKDVIWIQQFLHELHILNPNFKTPTTLFSDNQSAIRLCKDSTFHARTKHIDVHFHFIRQTVSRELIKIEYVPTDEMIADMFTKSLDRIKLAKFRSLLGLQTF